jgi:hypothetical protein
MQKINTYLIKWYGPFKSKESLKEWEDAHSEVFNLYIFQAKQKQRNDYNNKYYCGMAYRQTVGNRMKNNDHHIHDFENDKTDSLHIWIGTIANVSAKESEVRICENILTSVMANLGVGEKNLENRTNKKPPVYDVFIINEWWKTNGDEIMRRMRYSVPAVIPEVMEYYSETKSLYGTAKLGYLGKL